MTYLEEGVENTTLYNNYDDDPVDIDIANRVISLNSYGFQQVSWRQYNEGPFSYGFRPVT